MVATRIVLDARAPISCQIRIAATFAVIRPTGRLTGV